MKTADRLTGEVDKSVPASVVSLLFLYGRASARACLAAEMLSSRVDSMRGWVAMGVWETDHLIGWALFPSPSAPGPAGPSVSMRVLWETSSQNIGIRVDMSPPARGNPNDNIPESVGEGGQGWWWEGGGVHAPLQAHGFRHVSLGMVKSMEISSSGLWNRLACRLKSVIVKSCCHCEIF